MIRIGVICLLLIAAAFEYLGPNRESAFIAPQWDAQFRLDDRPHAPKTDSTGATGPVWTVSSSSSTVWPVVSCSSYPVVTSSP